MDGEDGVLYFKGENNNEYWIRPEEDDLIIIPGDLPHSPGLASKSYKDRIVVAGNVGFEESKQTKTLL
jgi:cupin superfamily acireductone dioxygenase involved in methionine salvage